MLSTALDSGSLPRWRNTAGPAPRQMPVRCQQGVPESYTYNRDVPATRNVE
jgi:hypothetical protein